MPRGHALTVLRHRDFALLFGGQFISTVGDQIQSVSIGWQMYVITGSPLQLGLVSAVRAVPFIVLSMFGGAVADAVDRRRMLFITQGVSMSIAVWLVAATILGRVDAITLYAATFLGGAAQAFDQPARQALVVNTVPAEELSNAFTVNTLLRQVTLIFGPAVGGLIIGAFGLGWSYGANAISFLALMSAVVLMRPVQVVRAVVGSNWERVVGGLRFGLAQPMVLVPLLVDFVTRCVGARRGLLVIFAHDVFRVGPQGLGWLNTADSLGAVAGGLVLGGVGSRLGRPVLVMMLAYAAEGLAVLGLGLSPSFYVALPVLFAAGVANVVAEVPRLTIVQLVTPDEMRGRVSALSGLFTNGGPQLGQLEAGAVASAVGAPLAATIGGSLMVIATLIFAVQPVMRRAYRLVPKALAVA